MKKNLLYLFSLLLIVGGFAGCSRDEKCPVELPVDFAGVYKGVLDVELNGTQIAQGLAQKVYITSVDGKKATLALKNFSFGEMELGDIVVRDVDVKQPRGTVVFSGSDIVNLAVGECQVNLAGNIVDKKMTTDIDVDVKGQEMKVKVKFNGEKMAADQSSEAQISDFTIEGAEVAFDEATKTYNVTVTNATEEDLKEITPAIKISDKATIVPAIGTAIDLSEGKEVKYTVTSEDGVVVNEYKVKVLKSLDRAYFDFEDLVEKYSVTKDSDKFKSYVPATQGIYVWDASDGGTKTLIGMNYADKFGVVGSDAGVEGKAMHIETLDTKGNGPILIFPATPKVTSGSLFLGKFILDLKDPLKSTKFGVVVDKKIATVRGSYKYKSGELYYECPNPGAQTSHIVEERPGVKDEGMIAVVVYNAKDKDGKDIILTGHDIYTSTEVIFKKQIEVAGTEEYKPFNVALDYEYDATKEYKLAVIFSSSKDGDKFSGAPGSILLIDNLEIIAEN